MYRIGIGLDILFNSNPCELISLHWFLRGNLYLFKISYQAEVVTSLHRSVTATSELTSAGCHLTPLASYLGWACQKVRLYGTFVSGLRQHFSWCWNYYSWQEDPLESEGRFFDWSRLDTTRPQPDSLFRGWGLIPAASHTVQILLLHFLWDLWCRNVRHAVFAAFITTFPFHVVARAHERPHPFYSALGVFSLEPLQSLAFCDLELLGLIVIGNSLS